MLGSQKMVRHLRDFCRLEFLEIKKTICKTLRQIWQHSKIN